MELILPVDFEQAIIDDLQPLGFQIGTAFPRTLPITFLRVVTTGGGQRDLVTDSPVMVLEVFSQLETTARIVAALALATLQAHARAGSIGGVTCYRLQVVALPQNYPLPSVPSHTRYLTTIAPDFRRSVQPL